MHIVKKKLSLLISFVLLLGSCNHVYSYYSGVKSMNRILDSYNVYYKNKLSHTYAILEKQQKSLLPKILDYNWNVDGVRQLTKDKLIVYLTPSSKEVELINKNMPEIAIDDMKYNLVYIHELNK
jgi:hypothetical protein